MQKLLFVTDGIGAVHHIKNRQLMGTPGGEVFDPPGTARVAGSDDSCAGRGEQLKGIT